MAELDTNHLDKGVSDAERNEFRERGFIVVEALTDAAELTTLAALYDQLFAARVGWEEGDQFDLVGRDEGELKMPQLLNPARYAPELLSTRLLANATALTRRLLGESASCSFAHAIFKPPHIAPATPWHQDAAYWPPEYDYEAISIWVPLQAATIENGCMHFVPGSHVNRHVHRHRSVNGDPRIHGLELDAEELAHVVGPVACPINAGAATVHGPYTLHYSGPNRSADPRRALILNGGLPATRRSSPRNLYWNDNKVTRRLERRARYRSQT